MSEQTSALPTEAPPKPVVRRRDIVAVASGNFIEFFDFALYGLMAVTLSKVFFPADTPGAALLSMLGLFAAAFVARPFGSLIFGSLGDRIGRKKTLILVVSIMSASTFCVGLIPGAATIGTAAPVIVLILRVVQGLSCGGEFGGGNTFLSESALPGRRCFRTSFTAASSFLAVGVSGIIIFILRTTTNDETMTAWGWRIPFLLAGPLGLVSLLMRSHLEETKKFEKIDKENALAKSPLAELFRKPGATLKSILFVAIQFASVYMITVYIPTYIQNQLHFPATVSTLSGTVAILTGSILTPLFATLADKFGRKPMMFIGCALYLVFTYPLFMIMQNAPVAVVVLCHAAFGVFLGTHSGVTSVVMTEIFPTRLRYSGASVGYNVGGAIFGGGAPYAAAWLLGASGNQLAPTWVLLFSAALTAIMMATIAETKNAELAD